jgi:ATPase subunit of ABC transporter with duplicated ATPase domains
LTRNGSGKSSLLSCIAQKLIPGLSPSLRILALSQIEDAAAATAQTGLSVLQYVVQGDKERLAHLDLVDRLAKAVEATSLVETQRVVNQIKLERCQEELSEARKVAQRRSGARGKAARKEEIASEEAVKLAEAMCVLCVSWTRP